MDGSGGSVEEWIWINEPLSDPLEMPFPKAMLSELADGPVFRSPSGGLRRVPEPR